MKLCVDNFALIKHAEIDIDGITVIAGNNNTGKSTVGKVLFSIFTALSNIDEKIERQRISLVQRKLVYLILQAAGEKSERLAWRLDGEFSDFISFQNEVVSIDWELLFEKYSKIVRELEQPEIQHRIKESVAQIMGWPRLRLLKDAIEPYFVTSFHKQINSLFTPNIPANVSLFIKDSVISMNFEDNSVTEITATIKLLNKAIFYSSPLVIDFLGARRLDNIPMMHLIALLAQYSERMTDDSDLLEKSMQRERLATILKIIDDVLPGTILKGRQGYGLDRPEWKEPLSIKNLSMGLKAFVVLKMLLESNQLKDRDVLILDEPEIHLHPTWQLIYAELIVLLQKEFDLSVVITTHSHFFLNAIETYSRKYATFDKLNLYLAEVEEGGAIIKNVSNDSEKIYKKMAEAVATLRSERIELAE